MFTAALAVALSVPPFQDATVREAAGGDPPPLIELLPSDAAAAGALDLEALRESPAVRRLLAAARAPGGVMPDDLVRPRGPAPAGPFPDPTVPALAVFFVAAPADPEPGAFRPRSSGLGGPVVLVRRSGPVPPWSIAAPPSVEERRRTLPDGRTAASRHRSAPAAALARLGEPNSPGGPPPAGPAAALRATYPNAAAFGWVDVSALRGPALADIGQSLRREDEAAVAFGLVRPLLVNVDQAAAALLLAPSTETPGEFDAVVHARAACPSAEAAATVRDTLKAALILARNAAVGISEEQAAREPAGAAFTERLTAPLRRALASATVEADGETVTVRLRTGQRTGY